MTDQTITAKMPVDDVAEAALLGSLMIQREELASVRMQVRPSDFFREAHEMVFRAILDVVDHGGDPDMPAVASELERRGWLEAVGGIVALCSLTSHDLVTAQQGAGACAVKVLSCWAKRILLRAGRDGDVPREDLDRATRILHDRQEDTFTDGGGSAVAEICDELEAVQSGLRDPIHIPWAPRLCDGALPTRPGTSTILAGRPGSSKSFLALAVCLAAYEARAPWAYLPLEDVRITYLLRALAVLTNDWEAIPRGSTTGDLARAVRTLEVGKNRIEDVGRSIMKPPGLGNPQAASWERVADWAERELERRKLVVVDSLSYVGFPDRDRHRYEDRFFCRLTEAAEKHQSCLWLVAHLRKRGGRERSSQPTIDDVQGGAGLGRAAHCVLILNRFPEESLMLFRHGGATEPCTANGTIHIDKARHGPDAGRSVAYRFGREGPTWHELGTVAPGA